LITLAFACRCAYADTLIITTPIPVTGGGTFWRSYPDVGGSAHGSGSDGTDSAAFSYYSCDSEGFSGGFISGSGGCTTALEGSFGDIDGVISSNFNVSLGDGGGVLDLYDSNDALIASAVLSGYVTDVSYVVPLFGDSGDVNGTYAIGAASGTGAAPEPATWMLMFVALSVIAVRWRLKNTGPLPRTQQNPSPRFLLARRTHGHLCQLPRQIAAGPSVVDAGAELM
jgi:hypothetical protein